MKKLKVGVDIDGVLIDMDPKTFLNFAKEKFGWKVNYEVFRQTHSWKKATGVESSDVFTPVLRAYFEQVENSQHPIEGAHDALRKISEQAEIHIITARFELIRDITEEYLQKFLPDVSYNELHTENWENKAGKVKDLDLDYYVDDSMTEISIILEDTSLRTQIIPFPGFHGMQSGWDAIQDERIHWLPVWEELKVGNISKEAQSQIHKRAWEQIADLILSR